jgi:hypothetical protein
MTEVKIRLTFIEPNGFGTTFRTALMTGRGHLDLSPKFYNSIPDPLIVRGH